MAEEFIKMPKKVLSRIDLPIPAKVLFCSLVNYQKMGRAFPSIQRLAEDMGTTRPTVRRAVYALENAGILKVTRRSHGQSNLYEITPSGNESFQSGDNRTGTDRTTEWNDSLPQLERNTPQTGINCDLKRKEALKEPVKQSPRGKTIERKKKNYKWTHEQVSAIYMEYPRKAAPAIAYKAIRKALSGMASGTGASEGKKPLGEKAPEALLDRVKEYAEATIDKDKKYIPYPASWFNGGHFHSDSREW